MAKAPAKGGFLNKFFTQRDKNLDMLGEWQGTAKVGTPLRPKNVPIFPKKKIKKK